VATPVNLNLDLIRDTFPGAVGCLAFGKYISPDYQVHPGEYIPPVGTRTGTPAVQGVNEIYFNLFLPSGPMPAGGWPVAIFGHPNGGYKEDPSNSVAGSMAAQGIATLAINAVGHGFGPLGTLTVNRSVGGPVTFSAGGRGIDQDGDGTIIGYEGLTTATPRGIVFFGDGIRQTVADLTQLVRVIEVGMDVDGDGQHDLDPSRIFYFGQSFGANYGTVFLAVEPSVRAGVLTVPGDPLANRQLGAGRPALGSLLDSRQPSLINAPGITVFGGRAVGPPLSHENLPLRDGIPLTVSFADGTTHAIQSPAINDVSGAMAIQEVLDNMEWVSQAGSPVAYAPHLRRAPLQGVPAKSVIFQFAKGDLGAANPNTTAMLRAGDLAERTLYYRHDLARAEIPSVAMNAHMFMVSVGVVAFRDIALGAQAQIAIFFASRARRSFTRNRRGSSRCRSRGRCRRS
jgi:dienelactone hydrolase